MNLTKHQMPTYSDLCCHMDFEKSTIHYTGEKAYFNSVLNQVPADGKAMNH